MTRNRKNLSGQRDYKYQDQERVPETFEDSDDPTSDYEDYFSEDSSWDDRTSVDSYEPTQAKTFCKTSGKIRYRRCYRRSAKTLCKRSSDPGRTRYKRSSDRKTVHGHFKEMKNRYAMLGDEEKSSCEEKEQPRPNQEDVLQQMAKEDENDWEVYHSKYVKKRILIESSVEYMAKKKWVDSWCHEDRELAKCVADGDEMIISIDGYFRKNRKAGYGVIIRNRDTGVPLLASAAAFEQGKPISPLYHELQGLNKGLELAIKYALGNIYIVQRSSCIVPDIARWVSYCVHNRYGNDANPNTFCKICAKKSYFKDCTDEDYQLHIYPLMQEIRDNFAMLKSSFVCSYGSVMNKHNKAADYLAKLQVNKEEMEPHEFPEELKDILYEESLEGDLMSAIRKSRADEEFLFC